MRYGGKETLYDVLDLPRGAGALEVENAYRRIRAEMEKEGAMPDARRESMLREAYEVLGNDQRRAAYDASLLNDRVTAAPPRRVPTRAIAMAASIAVIAALLFVLLRPRPSDSALRAALTEQANVSVARLVAIDVAGARKAVGFATNTEEGAMATTCHGLTPGAQLVVNNGSTALGATIAIADYAADICKLSVASGASRPLTSALPLPRAHDRLYLSVPAPDGTLAIEPVEVKGTANIANGAAIEIDRAIAPGEDGAAVFDAQGRMAGITTSVGSTADGRGVVLPAAWIAAARTRPAPPR